MTKGYSAPIKSINGSIITAMHPSIRCVGFDIKTNFCEVADKINADNVDFGDDFKSEFIPNFPTKNHSRRKKFDKSAWSRNERIRKIEPLTKSIRITRNGGVVKCGSTYKWHAVWKKLDHKISRHDGKIMCNKYEYD